MNNEDRQRDRYDAIFTHNNPASPYFDGKPYFPPETHYCADCQDSIVPEEGQLCLFCAHVAMGCSEDQAIIAEMSLPRL